MALPEITFCETDGSSIEAEIISTYETIAETSLAAGDPVRLFLEGLAYTITLQRQVIDLSGKKNLLYYAKGDYLDHLGNLTDTERIEAYAATVTMRFSLSAVHDSAVTIPAGTRVTPDSSLMFETDEVAEIAAGDLYADVSATCQTAGTTGNGYVAGQINRLVDTVAGVSSVTNTTISLGGSAIESDDRYRERIQLSPESASVAGPAGKYEYWAKSAHQDIADVAVLSPDPGEVDIIVLLNDGELPSQAVLDAVEETVSPADVRPLTDNVSVLAPDQVEYSIILTYYIASSKKTLAASIQEAVNSAVDEYVDWQCAALGRDINPTELVHLIRSAGAKRVVITSPVDTVLSKRQVAVLAAEGLSVTYGGIEDD